MIYHISDNIYTIVSDASVKKPIEVHYTNTGNIDRMVDDPLAVEHVVDIMRWFKSGDGEPLDVSDGEPDRRSLIRNTLTSVLKEIRITPKILLVERMGESSVVANRSLSAEPNGNRAIIIKGEELVDLVSEGIPYIEVIEYTISKLGDIPVMGIEMIDLMMAEIEDELEDQVIENTEGESMVIPAPKPTLASSIPTAWRFPYVFNHLIIDEEIILSIDVMLSMDSDRVADVSDIDPSLSWSITHA